jgi:(+)-trans-carveol dehydrogenase
MTPDELTSETTKPVIEARAVSNAVLFLASDEAQYITGAALPIDAGAVAKF